MPHLRELKQRLSESRVRSTFGRLFPKGLKKRVWTLPSVSCFNRARALLACYQRDARRLNNHNTAKRMTTKFAVGEFWRRHSRLDKFNTCQWHSACTKFGHSDNLITLSLSLSLRRSPTREVTTPFILRTGRPR